jgi:hypothetical protein
MTFGQQRLLLNVRLCSAAAASLYADADSFFAGNQYADQQIESPISAK